MNDDFAVEPAAFRDSKDLKYALEKFGFPQGRFLAIYPNRWVKQVYERIATFDDLERLRATTLLAKYKEEALVRCGLPYVPSQTWVENCIPHLQSSAFKKVVVADGSQINGLLTLDEIDESALGDSRCARILAKAADYRKIATRLIDMSYDLWIVDPYFKITRPNRARVLGELISAASRKGQTGRKVTVFARHSECADRSTEVAIVRLMNRHSEPGVKLEIKLVDDSCSPNKMHARYLISTRGALQFDKGFSEEIDDQYVTIDAVSGTMHQVLCDLFIESMHSFQEVETFTWPK